MKMNNKRRDIMRRGGFTIIELVMVIIILGLLAAAALPTFYNLQNQAKEAACKSALGALRTGIAEFYCYMTARGYDVRLIVKEII